MNCELNDLCITYQMLNFQIIYMWLIYQFSSLITNTVKSVTTQMVLGGTTINTSPLKRKLLFFAFARSFFYFYFYLFFEDLASASSCDNVTIKQRQIVRRDTESLALIFFFCSARQIYTQIILYLVYVYTQITLQRCLY